MVPAFNQRFMTALRRAPAIIRPSDELALFIYLGAFDGNMRYPLRDADPQNLFQACQEAMDLQRIFELRMTRSHRFIRVNSHVSECRIDQRQAGSAK